MAATTHSAPLAMVEQLQRPACVAYARFIVRGTIYAFRGGSGFGLYDKWGDEPRGLCFVGKFEYSHNNPKPGTKFGSFDKARKAAIHGLHHACSGEERASVQAVLDSDQREAAAAEARAKMEHGEAEAKRRAVAEARAAEHRMAVEATERQRLAAEAQRLAIEEAQMAAAAKRRDEAAAAEEERTRQEAAAALVLRDWLTAGCLRRQVCLMADDALNSRLRAAAAEEAAEAAAEVAEVCVDELLRAWVVEAMATWRCGKSGQRSAEAKRTRRRAAKRRRSSLKNGANGVERKT